MMRKNWYLLLCLILPLLACLGFIWFEKSSSKPKIVFIQPLGDVTNEDLLVAKNAIQSFYGINCFIRNGVNLSKDLLNQSGQRYDAGKILTKFNSSDNVLVLTNKDITTRKGNISEWGIFGLAIRPGTICAISTFRLKRNVNQNKFHERLKKVVLHEIGHNLGLEHCQNHIKCLMNDARGTIKQVDGEDIWLCESCKLKL